MKWHQSLGLLALAALAQSELARGQAAPAATRSAGPPVVAELSGSVNERAARLVSERTALLADLRDASTQATARVKELLPEYGALSDESHREALAADLTAAVRKLAQVQIARHELGGRRNVLMAAAGANMGESFTFVENCQLNAALLLAVGDQAGAKLIADYADFDSAVAEFGATLLRADAAEQARLMDALVVRLQAEPFNETVADEAVMAMKRRCGPDEARLRLFAAMERLGPEAAPAIRMFVQMSRAREKFGRMQQLVGTKDFKAAGQLIDGSPFDSTSLAGKVVVVDFWATWCGPCVAELPRLAKLLDKHRDEGLAIVGVNNDYDRESVQSFLKRRPDVSWPQLFDAASAANSEKHALTRDAGILAIPALFVIDRRGVLRSVTARETLEQKVAELLREPAEELP